MGVAHDGFVPQHTPRVKRAEVRRRGADYGALTRDRLLGPPGSAKRQGYSWKVERKQQRRPGSARPSATPAAPLSPYAQRPRTAGAAHPPPRAARPLPRADDNRDSPRPEAGQQRLPSNRRRRRVRSAPLRRRALGLGQQPPPRTHYERVRKQLGSTVTARANAQQVLDDFHSADLINGAEHALYSAELGSGRTSAQLTRRMRHDAAGVQDAVHSWSAAAERKADSADASRERILEQIAHLRAHQPLQARPRSLDGHGRPPSRTVMKRSGRMGTDAPVPRNTEHGANASSVKVDLKDECSSPLRLIPRTPGAGVIVWGVRGGRCGPAAAAGHETNMREHCHDDDVGGGV
eukprot:COSAG01_NODE_5304_length_4350_cov_8.058104_2_plen_349_part_00